jgi:hypothetical protein
MSANLSACLPFYLPVCPPAYLSAFYLPACLPVCLLVWLSGSLAVCLSICLPVCLSACLPTCLSAYLCVCLSISQFSIFVLASTGKLLFIYSLIYLFLSELFLSHPFCSKTGQTSFILPRFFATQSSPPCC